MRALGIFSTHNGNGCFHSISHAATYRPMAVFGIFLSHVVKVSDFCDGEAERAPITIP
jgi:hypothetical protein